MKFLGGVHFGQFCWAGAAGLSEPYPIIVYSVANYRQHVVVTFEQM